MITPHETLGVSVAATPAGFVDLQVHTTASDGALSPSVVVAAAQQANLVAIAITDHDTVDGVGEAQAAGVVHNVRIVPGVELSTHFEGQELHLLGLHLSDLDGMQAALAQFQRDRVERAHHIVRLLQEQGIPVRIEAVLAEAGQGAVGRPHIARAMVAGGWVVDFRDAFDRWLGTGRKAFVDKPHFAVADGIALVHRAGGLAFWAHPGDMATAARVAALTAVGLDGIEVLHPGHTPTASQRIATLVEQSGLLPSGGSDWHGVLEGARRLGGQEVPADWLRRQDERVAMRRAT